MLIHIVKPKLRQYHLLHVLLKLFISIFPVSIFPVPKKDIDCFASLQYFGTLSPTFPEMCSLPKDIENYAYMWYLQLVY